MNLPQRYIEVRKKLFDKISFPKSENKKEATKTPIIPRFLKTAKNSKSSLPEAKPAPKTAPKQMEAIFNKLLAFFPKLRPHFLIIQSYVN